jgi:hypothetical protein
MGLNSWAAGRTGRLKGQSGYLTLYNNADNSTQHPSDFLPQLLAILPPSQLFHNLSGWLLALLVSDRPSVKLEV